jgi:hypothetical protein
LSVIHNFMINEFLENFEMFGLPISIVFISFLCSSLHLLFSHFQDFCLQFSFISYCVFWPKGHHHVCKFVVQNCSSVLFCILQVMQNAYKILFLGFKYPPKYFEFILWLSPCFLLEQEATYLYWFHSVMYSKAGIVLKVISDGFPSCPHEIFINLPGNWFIWEISAVKLLYL